MSGKKDKKLRKEIQLMNRERIKVYQKKVEEIAQRDANIFKVKPVWIPMVVWLWVLGFFVRINKTKK